MPEMLTRHARLLAAPPPSPALEGGPLGAAVPGAATAGVVLDREAIARLAELDPTGKGGLIERVLQAFRTSAARLTPQLDAALVANDPAAVRMVAHTLKSSSASIGALELSRCCARVEAETRDAVARPVGPEVDTLKQALAQALEAIDRHLKAPP